MSDPIDQEQHRARVLAARRTGTLCAGCGRALAADEPVWLERLPVGGTYRRAPVGAECASPAFLRATDGLSPLPCAHCGRGVYYRDGAWSSIRRRALCSRVCDSRYHTARRRGKTSS